jgi:ferric-dicitrate binding protein FerR (iron transport regulator)
MVTVNSPGDRRAALRREAQAWLLHLTSGQATTADAEAFRRWHGISDEHALAFSETRVLWENLGPAAKAVSARRQRGPRMTRRAFLGGAVAASAAFVLLRSPIGPWSGTTPDYRTATGEQRRIELAGNVVVHMNTQTAIKVQSGGAGIELIAGEAFVRTDARLPAPFVVTAEGGRVLACAASECNVRCIGTGVQVTCLDGMTELTYEGRHATVKPSQQVGYDDRGVGAALAVNPAVAMAWRDRVLIFDGQPLSDVIEDINRYRPGKIILADGALAARKVHARFSLDQMADVTNLIRDAYGARVTELPGGIVVLS